MSKSGIGDYGKRIEHRLIDIDQSKAWLVKQVRHTTGGYFDSSYLRKIMCGTRKAPKIISAINEILELSPKLNDDTKSVHESTGVNVYENIG